MTYSGTKKARGKGGSIAEILGISISSSRRGEVLGRIVGWLMVKGSGGGIRLVFTPNAEMLVEANQDGAFRRVLNSADVNIPDGVGVVLASKLLHQNISETVSGTDLAHDLVLEAAKQGWRVFYLGGQPGVAVAAGRMLEIEAREAGFAVSPRFAWKAGRPEEGEVVEEINEFAPEILLVALGHKKQEMWLVENRERLRVKLGMGVGGAFDFWAGRVKRAPVWVRRLGFEWLWRLLQEPWRWRRQLRLFKFVYLVFREAAKGKK